MADAPAAGQVWNAAGYARHAGFVPELGQDVLALLDPKPGERVVDIGCGDGALTDRIVAAGAVVTGVEADPDLARAARGRGLAVVEQDAHRSFGDGTFDAAFSNAALHWMLDPDTVFANVRRALRPGGRFVAEQGGFGNVAAIRVALDAALEAAGLRAPDPGPWDFPTPDLQRRRLLAAGFDVVSIGLVPRPTPLPTGFGGWLRTFAGRYVDDLTPDDRARVLSDTVRRLVHLTDEGGTCVADYVRLRFAAVARA